MVTEGTVDGGAATGAAASGPASGDGDSGDSGGSAGGQAAKASGLAALATKVPGDPGAPAANPANAGLVPEAPKYAPNFKYKVKAANGEVSGKLEKEIPEWARPLVTSPELEKSVKELFEKSEGIEAVKQHRDILTQENEQMRTEWAPIVKNVQTVVGHLERGDLDSFFEALNIPEQQVLKYALYRLQLRDNPQQLQAVEQARALQNQNFELQQKVEQYSGGYEKLAVQQRTIELDSQVSRPEIQELATAFDSQLGKVGAFRAECIRRGQMYAAQGQDPTAEQVVSEVAQLLGWRGEKSPTAPVAADPSPPAAVTAEPKPTFPSIRGKGTSPARKAITSTAQLRELARSRA